MNALSPYVCSATPGHELIDADGKSWPIVAWEISGMHARPMTALPVGRGAQAVIFPDGQVVDFDTEECYADTESWRSATAEVDRDPDRHRAGAVEAKTAEAESVGADTVVDENKSIRDLGLSGRACAPMEREGINTVSDLRVWTRKEVLAIKGVPTTAGKVLDSALKDAGWSWKDEARTVAPKVSEPEDDDDDVEDLI